MILTVHDHGKYLRDCSGWCEDVFVLIGENWDLHVLDSILGNEGVVFGWILLGNECPSMV